MKRFVRCMFAAVVSLAAACSALGRGAPASVTPGEPRSAPALPTTTTTTTAATSSAGSLESRLRKSARLSPILDQASTYRFQVLVSVPDPSGSGWLEREGFRVDAEYFYPASAIKLCAAVAALEALQELREAKGSGLDVRATLVSESSAKRRGGASSIANLVLGALVMSDNEASNDLFDLAGYDGFHERMWRIGLSTVRMRHRLGLAPGDARASPRIELVASGDPVVIAPREGQLVLGKNEQSGVFVGDSHIHQGRLVEGPMSFEEKNRISLADLQDLLVGVVRPDLRLTGAPRLGAQEREVLMTALTGLPSARGAPPLADREHKPLLEGLSRVIPRASLTLASKSGRAYGFLVENAYVLDARTGRSFFVTVTIYANANGRMNDDLYEYDSRAFPAVAELGELLARTLLDPPPP